MVRAAAFALLLSSFATFAGPSPGLAKARKTFADWQKKMKKSQPGVTFTIDWKKVEKGFGVDAFEGQLLLPIEDAFKALQSDDFGRRHVEGRRRPGLRRRHAHAGGLSAPGVGPLAGQRSGEGGLGETLGP